MTIESPCERIFATIFPLLQLLADFSQNDAVVRFLSTSKALRKAQQHVALDIRLSRAFLNRSQEASDLVYDFEYEAFRNWIEACRSDDDDLVEAGFFDEVKSYKQKVLLSCGSDEKKSTDRNRVETLLSSEEFSRSTTSLTKITLTMKDIRFPVSLANYRNLECIEISRTDGLIPPLAFPILRSCELYDIELATPSLPLFPNSPRLQTLSIDDVRNVTEVSLSTLSKMKCLRELALRGRNKFKTLSFLPACPLPRLHLARGSSLFACLPKNAKIESLLLDRVSQSSENEQGFIRKLNLHGIAWANLVPAANFPNLRSLVFTTGAAGLPSLYGWDLLKPRLVQLIIRCLDGHPHGFTVTVDMLNDWPCLETLKISISKYQGNINDIAFRNCPRMRIAEVFGKTFEKFPVDLKRVFNPNNEPGQW